jgi:hypothetical protein
MQFFIRLLVCIFFISSLLCGQVGYFCVPVADLIAQPFSKSEKYSVADLYDTISISPERGKDSCLRVHQGIFNEQVTILRYENQQVYIELTNCFAQSMPGQNQLPTRFWTRSDWVISEEMIDHLEIDRSIFPNPISYKEHYRDKCITLLLPWYDSVTNTVYCAGTRFVIVKKKTDEKGYCVKLYDNTNKTATMSIVPRSIALPLSFETSAEQRYAFVELLQLWCSLDGSIPYVWGGSNFSYLCEDDFAVLQEEYKNGAMVAYWNRPGIKQYPYSGFDASGLILRAAQIVGAPYYCINSTTVANSLQPLQKGELLEEGDILWAPGYVGVVSNINRNELIEAQGYARGYGKIHAINLEKKFADIFSWKDFLYFYEHGFPLQSLNSEGQVVGTVLKYILFKFPTVARGKLKY